MTVSDEWPLVGTPNGCTDRALRIVATTDALSPDEAFPRLGLEIQAADGRWRAVTNQDDEQFVYLLKHRIRELKAQLAAIVSAGRPG